MKETVKQEISYLMEENQLFWGKVYCKDHFRDKSPLFHLIILMKSMRSKRLAVAAPRGGGKSTVLTFLKSLHGICTKKYRYILICQNTNSKASESLQTIKTEIKENVLIRKSYGIKLEKDSASAAIFVHPDGFKTMVLAVGAEQIGDVRGRKFGAYRPDLIIIDDLEDDIMVKNPETREEIKKNFKEALIPAGQFGKTDYLAVGTILHYDCLIADLVSPSKFMKWDKLKFQALWKNTATLEYESIWPELWSVDDLLEMQAEDPVKFAKEYQNDPVSGVLSKFKPENFRRWEIKGDEYICYGQGNRISSRGYLKDCTAAISCDLAWEERRSADDSVIMPAFLTPHSDLLIDTYVKKKGLRPSELEEHIFIMEEKYRKITGKTVYIGFEKAKLEKVMKFFLKEAMRRRNQFLNFKDLLWAKDKSERIITALEARYAQNSVYHKSGMGDLEEQLMKIPSGSNDDLADAASGLPQLLQFAPTKPKTEEKGEDEHFQWLRKLAINKDRINKTFGKRATSLIPAKTSFR